MNTQGTDTLKAVARRSLWLVALLVVLGIVLMDLMRHQQGPQYQATSQVVLSPTDLSQLFSGSSAFVDPNLLDQTEKALANSPQLFDRASRSTRGLGSGGQLQGMTSVSKSGTTISFTASGSNPRRVVEVANAVAEAYPRWRASVAGAAIQSAIVQVQSQLQAAGGTRSDLISQLNRLKVLKTLTTGNVLLVEPVTQATKTRPRTIRDSIIGGLIGLFIALVLVAVREAVDTRVRSEEEVEEVLDVPVVGSVESLPRNTRLVGDGSRRERFNDMYALLAANVAQESRRGPTVIAVTSATAREGKTTTAANLAAALARRNAHVLLVDLDTRKPAIARFFRIPPEASGLERAFQHGGDLGRLIWTASLNGAGASAEPPVVEAGGQIAGNGQPEGSLRVLPLMKAIKGGIAAHRDDVATVLARLGEESDYVVVDTSPALSLPDVTELANLVDIVMVVVRHGRVSRRSLKALNRLHRSWPNVRTNAVLVGVPRKGTYSSYYDQ